MLSTVDLERLITVKRREIEKEKTVLGLSSPQKPACLLQDIEDHTPNVSTIRSRKQVKEHRVTDRDDAETEDKKERDNTYHVEEIPADLERYIRRYLGLPVMLKAGEFSPNNPLVRGERAPGDALRGLGEYERRRNTLRRLRQQQYREYLDQQAKKKQEAKEQAERERREREEKERQEEEERERLRRQLEERESEEQRRASVCYVQSSTVNTTPAFTTANSDYRNKVDTGVQVGSGKPLSVGVQTDDAELYRLSPSPSPGQLTQAERELSPRTVEDADERPIRPTDAQRRRSYGDFHDRPSLGKSNREKLVADLRHSYMPSIFDADAIQRRNLQAEKEAAERRQFYQQELKNQIQEQQRIREERQTREKMLEQAEMRRLEEQLRMLRADQRHELRHHRQMAAQMKENASEFNIKRTALQKEIDSEQQKLLRATTQPVAAKRTIITSRSDTTLSQLPFYYSKNQNKSPEKRPPFSTNIPDNSIFSPNYDVESYLRRNLNPSRESLMSNRIESVSEHNYADIDNISADYKNYENDKKIVVEKALVHDRPKEKRNVMERPKYEPSCLKKDLEVIANDVTPIPVLRHTPKVANDNDSEKLSESMKRVDDKWKVPAVQKNILKTLPNNEGKNVSILTQLGSIRRQLQLEQMRLDSMVKSDKS